jgi:CBS domain-containing protein
LVALPEGDLLEWVRRRPVAGAMTRAVLTLAPDTGPMVASWAAARRGVRRLPVIYDGAVVGVVSRTELEEATGGATVGDLMHTPPLTARLDTPLAVAARTMVESAVGCLPVISRGMLHGIITLGDLRRVGLPEAETTPATCASCGADERIRICPRTAVPFCVDCLERSSPPEWWEEIGGSG